MGTASTPDDQASLQRQVDIFSKYMVGQLPSAEVGKRYARTVRQWNAKLTPQDIRLLSLMVRRPWLVGPIDAGLVFTNPASEVRRRLFLVFALLEATPEFYDAFLPRQRSPLYLVVVGLVGVRAVCRALVGIIITKRA